MSSGQPAVDDSGNPVKITADVHLGWWVAGDLSTVSDIDTLAALNATAHYDGHVLGDVAKLTGDQWNTYVAAGSLAMNWNFTNRNGDLTISQFDGDHSFGSGPGGMSQIPNLNQFSGSISGSGLSGNATGSFMRGPDSSAQGVAGNWNVSGTGYNATGIFCRFWHANASLRLTGRRRTRLILPRSNPNPI